MRLTDLSFGTGVDPRTLELENEFPDGKPIYAASLSDRRLVVRATIFSPGRLPLRVQIRFLQGRTLLRASRNLDVVAHRRGFRVWCAINPGPSGLVPGKYRAEVWTSEGQLLGRQALLAIPGVPTDLRGGATAKP